VNGRASSVLRGTLPRFSRGTEENYEKSGSPVSGLRFEPCSPEVWIRIVIHSVTWCLRLLPISLARTPQKTPCAIVTVPCLQLRCQAVNFSFSGMIWISLVIRFLNQTEIESWGWCTKTGPVLATQLKHRNYNSVTESHTWINSSNHSQSVHRSISNASCSTNRPWLTLLWTEPNWTELKLTELVASFNLQDNSFARTPRKSRLPFCGCMITASLSGICLPAALWACRSDRIEDTVSLPLNPVFLFAELLPGSALIKSVTIISRITD
jgi:hypothetical protein